MPPSTPQYLGRPDDEVRIPTSIEQRGRIRGTSRDPAVRRGSDHPCNRPPGDRSRADRRLHTTRPTHFSTLIAVLTVVALALSPLALLTAADAARNKAPRLKAIGTQTVHAGQVLTVRPKASDPDRGPQKLRFSASGRPTWLGLNTKTGTLTGRAPVSAAAQQWRITLRVTDGRATSARTFTVRMPANQAPRLAAISNRNVTAGDELVVQPRADRPRPWPEAAALLGLVRRLLRVAEPSHVARPRCPDGDAHRHRPAGRRRRQVEGDDRGHRRPALGQAELHAAR